MSGDVHQADCEDTLKGSITHHAPGNSPLQGESAYLLQSWIEDKDAQEQKETGEYLLQVLDEDRLSDRRLFPPELKGVTW